MLTMDPTLLQASAYSFVLNNKKIVKSNNLVRRVLSLHYRKFDLSLIIVFPFNLLDASRSGSYTGGGVISISEHLGRALDNHDELIAKCNL